MLRRDVEFSSASTDNAGSVRISDSGGKPRRVAVGAAQANTRYSISRHGERRAYRFQRNDSRALDNSTLVLHFAGAEWVSPRRFDARHR